MKLRKRYSDRLNRGRSAGYSYTNTRVKAMKAKLLKKEDFERFTKMSLAEITRFLQETEYSKEITQLAAKHSGINLVEYALNRNLENTFSRICRFSMQHARKQVRLYLMRYDAANIKTILRGKFSKMNDEKIVNELVASGWLSREFLEKAVRNSGSAGEAVEHFRRTEFYGVLKAFQNDLTKMEDEMDKFYYSYVLENAGKELKDYIRREICVKNALNRMRAEKGNIKIELIPGDKKIRMPRPENTAESRISLKRHLVEHSLRMAREVKHNVRPVLGYFIAKENEISNVRILVRGRHSKLGEDVIQKQLVI